jgi:hypothetical protein
MAGKQCCGQICGEILFPGHQALFSEDLLKYLVAVDLRIHYYHKHKNKSLDSFILALLHIKHTISYQIDTLFILRCIQDASHFASFCI